MTAQVRSRRDQNSSMGVRGSGADPAAQRAGEVSAWTSVALAVLYIPAIAGAFGAPPGPAQQAFFAVAQVLIILTALPLVGVAAALYLCAPAGRRIWGLGGFGFMLLLAGTTIGLHFVELTVARRLPVGSPAGPLFSWEWPGVLYGVEVVAWDLFFGIAMVCAALTLPGHNARWARRLLLASGLLSLAGLVGPALDVMALRTVGIFGYTIVFPVAALVLARLLRKTRAPETD